MKEWDAIFPIPFFTMRYYFHFQTLLCLGEIFYFLFIYIYPCQEITPYTGGMFLRDGDLKALPLTLGAYSNIGNDQPYTRGKFCGWMIKGCEDDL